MKKRNKSYVIWIVILAILYLVIRNTLFGAIFFSAVVMLILSIIIAKIIINGISIQIDIEKKSIERGNKLYFNIRTINKTIFPSNKLYVKLKINNAFFDGKEECYVNIPASIRGEDIICSDVKCDYVGNINIEATQLIIMDYLGLVKYTKEISREANVLVMPMDINYSISMDNALIEADEGDKKANTLDSSEIKGIREYKEGDTLHRIHWKLSSKFDELMVKEFETSVEANINLLIDLVKGKYDTLNETIEVLYSLVKKLLGSGVCGVTVNWYDDSKEDYTYYDINSMDDLNTMIEYIYNTNFSTSPGMVYYSYIMKNSITDEEKNIYVTSMDDNQEGRVIGVYNDMVVLMCI